MGYTLDKSYKIVKLSRKQLYGSKIFFDPSQNLIVRFKNFSDNQMQTKKISDEDSPTHVFPICKIEEYYGLTKNKTLFNLEVPNGRRVANELKDFDLKNSKSHLNYLLVETDQNKVCLFVFDEGLKCRMLGIEEKSYYWHISTGGRLVGVSYDQTRIKITCELNNKRNEVGGIAPDDVWAAKASDQTNLSLRERE